MWLEVRSGTAHCPKTEPGPITQAQARWASLPRMCCIRPPMGGRLLNMGNIGASS